METTLSNYDAVVHDRTIHDTPDFTLAKIDKQGVFTVSAGVTPKMVAQFLARYVFKVPTIGLMAMARFIVSADAPPKPEDIRIDVADSNEQAIVLDGLDDALIGRISRCGQPDLACYGVEAMIDVLQTRDGLTREDAREYVDFNILGAWMGENTPAYLHKPVV